MKMILVLVFVLIAVNNLFAQSCSQEDYISVINTKMITTSYGLVNFLDTDFSSMYYCPELFSDENGSGFILDYVDEGGSGMDAYPNATCGGIKKGGVWYPGDKAKVGMPVQISDISNEMNFVWHTSQENAWDSDDGWMSSVNFIFDNYGTENSEPVKADRDFDLVVKLHSHNFADNLTDQPTPAGVRIWYFARETNGDLKPYELTVDGVTYTYAVRYKFFVGAGDKDNKAHVKLIPYGPAGAPYNIKVNVKEVINVAKNYIQYANMPQAQRDLANTNIAPDHSWLKTINAGYEVYSGTSVLKTDKFKVNTTDEVSAIDETVTQSYIDKFHLYDNYPNPFNPETTISFDLSGRSFVKLEIYNILGQLVKTIIDQELSRASYKYKWDGKDKNGHLTGTGIYLYRLESSFGTEVKKMTFMK
ncbi:MAG: T9SS type A sorting domain-containing protein [Melioribacteraceae bacterium]|nr:T9SS type A sorting domain-containing protein [Melioribacteraceae bacterium]